MHYCIASQEGLNVMYVTLCPKTNLSMGHTSSQNFIFFFNCKTKKEK